MLLNKFMNRVRIILIINTISAVIFAVLIRISGFCISFDYSYMRAYGIKIFNVHISHIIIEVILLSVFLIYLITFILLIIAFIKKSLIKKLQIVSFFMTLLFMFSIIVISLNEYERSASIFSGSRGEHYGNIDLDDIYIFDYIDVEDYKIVLGEWFIGELEINASKEAIDAFYNNYLKNKQILFITLRKNNILSPNYRVFSFSDLSGNYFYIENKWIIYSP